MSADGILCATDHILTADVKLCDFGGLTGARPIAISLGPLLSWNPQSAAESTIAH
jgi:hypothetical protein